MKNLLRNLIRDYCQKRIHRHQLLAMDERTRKDLAISRVDAEQLAGRYRVEGCGEYGGGLEDERD